MSVWAKINQILHFWNQESVFPQTLHRCSLSWNITLLYFFILYALDKSIGSKCKYSDFRLLTWKLTKIFYVIFQGTSQFFLKFCIILQCHDTKFLWNFLTETLQYMLWTKRAHQCTMFQTFECSNRSSPNSSCHFWNHQARAYSNSTLLFSVMKDNSSIFLAKTSYTLDKNSTSKWNFRTFEWLGRLKFTKFLMTYLKSQFSFSLNFASLFNLMRDNSSVLF